MMMMIAFCKTGEIVPAFVLIPLASEALLQQL